MRTLDLLGIPHLPERAFSPDAFGSIRPQGGGKGSAPKPPDYPGAAAATAKGNLDMAKYATQANRPNQYTPWGSLEWSNDRQFNESAYNTALENYNRQLAAYNNAATQPSGGGSYTTGFGTVYQDPNDLMSGGSGGGSGSAMKGSKPVAPNMNDFYTGGNDWTQTVKLSPEMQALFDQQNQLQQGLFGAQDQALGRVNETMGQGFDMSQLPSSGSVYDPNLATNNAAELLMQRMNPDLDRQQEALRAQLANQGITQGSQAYNTAMGQFGQQRNDALTQAQLQGIGLGMQQQGMQFGQSQQARQQALQEQAYLRNLPLNELNALRTGNQVGMPQFSGFAQQATTGGPDLLGAANAGYQAQLGAYNADQAAGGSMLGGLFGIGSALLGGAGAAGGFSQLFS